MDLEKKSKQLMAELASLGSVVVAFSGGVDSTLLLKAAHLALGEQVLAVTARSLSFPGRELREAMDFTDKHGIAHVLVDSEELDIEGFSHNPLNRCYLCKTELFEKIAEVARQRGIAHIAEGSNADDEGDYRPGLQAVAEKGVLSPLRRVGLTKAEIRALSRQWGLPTWEKQSFACLSSRFPYGEEITPERLRRVDAAEQYLLDLGLRQVRVRSHGDLARIETDSEGLAQLTAPALRERVHSELKSLGFAYVAADLLGYRTGSMNETIPVAAKG